MRRYRKPTYGPPPSTLNFLNGDAIISTILEKLRPYVSIDDVDLSNVALARLIADRAEDDVMRRR